MLAGLVGEAHDVDLNHPDVVILVEIFKVVYTIKGPIKQSVERVRLFFCTRTFVESAWSPTTTNSKSTIFDV